MNCKKRVDDPSPSDATYKTVVAEFEQVILHTQAAPGNHRALPGTHGGGLGGRRSAPTADGRLRRMSWGGKGLSSEALK